MSVIPICKGTIRFNGIGLVKAVHVSGTDLMLACYIGSVNLKNTVHCIYVHILKQSRTNVFRRLDNLGFSIQALLSKELEAFQIPHSTPCESIMKSMDVLLGFEAMQCCRVMVLSSNGVVE